MYSCLPVKAHKKLGHLLAFVTILIWSVTFVQTKVLLEYLTPIEILIYRFAVAAVILYIMHPSAAKTSLRTELYLAFSGFSGIFLYYVLENIALTLTGAANVGLLVTTSPIFTALFARLILKSRIGINLLIGFLLALAGMLLMLFDRIGSISIGDLLALLAAASFGIYSVVLKLIPEEYHYLYVTRKSFLYGLVFMVIFWALTDPTLHVGALQKPVVFINLLFLAVFASGVCFVFWRICVNLIGSVATSNYIYLIPLLNGIASVVILKEHIGVRFMVAAALIIVGLIISQRGRA